MIKENKREKIENEKCDNSRQFFIEVRFYSTK